jgi:hypothetical protein
MPNKSITVPHPGTSKDDYERMVRIWAAYTGLQPNDPYVLITAHIYGLYEQMNNLSGNNEVLASIAQLTDRLNQLESPGNAHSGLDPQASKTLAGIAKQLASLEKRLNKIDEATPTWEAIQTQIILILQGTAILIRRQKDEAKNQAAAPSPPGVAESSNLRQAINQSGYKFVPTHAQKFGGWFNSFISDLSARYFLNLLGILIGCGLFGVCAGLGMQYAQSNHFFDKPTATPNTSPANKK